MNWVDLPNGRSHKTSNPHRHDDILKLKMQPGVWAELSIHANPKAARQVVLRLRKRYNGHPYDDQHPYEFTSRVWRPAGDLDITRPVPQAKVYGRWVGESPTVIPVDTMDAQG
jgi:hypothetical protein